MIDPVTVAIVAAITAGAASGAGKVAKQAIVDTYSALKVALKGRFGQNSEIVKAVDSLEAKPESAGRKAVLSEEVSASKADKDPEILTLAQKLIEAAQVVPRGKAQADQGDSVMRHSS